MQLIQCSWCVEPSVGCARWRTHPLRPVLCFRGAKGRAQRAFRRRAEEMEEEAAALEEEGLRKRRRTREPAGEPGAGPVAAAAAQCWPWDGVSSYALRHELQCLVGQQEQLNLHNTPTPHAHHACPAPAAELPAHLSAEVEALKREWARHEAIMRAIADPSQPGEGLGLLCASGSCRECSMGA